MMPIYQVLLCKTWPVSGVMLQHDVVGIVVFAGRAGFFAAVHVAYVA